MLHVTDPHLFAGPDESLRGMNTRLSLKRVLDHVMSGDWTADLVALTGDLVQDNTRDAYKRLRAMFGALQLPVYCVPGNHDVPELMREELRQPRFHYCAGSTRGNWLILGLDSCLVGEARGRIATDELERLAKELAETNAEYALVCLHHPPMSVGSRWLDSVGLENGEDFLRLIAASGKVRAAIFGHIHQAFDGEYSGIKIIGTPSTCRQFALNSDEFKLDDNPPAYRRLELHADGTIFHELVKVHLHKGS